MNPIRIPLAIALLAGNLPAEEREPLYRESLRPQFHFTARYWDDYRLHPPHHEEGWMNDINGLVHFDGEYHFFAQRWWSAWLHAVSTDLIHWKELRPAFGKGGKFGGTQSGGGVIDHRNSSGLGDGVTPPMIAFWSSTDNLSQCISYSLDRGLTWSKYDKNPVLSHGFRDPKVFWHEPTEKWIMILYGPSDTAPPPAYGFNGEQNDAHDLRSYAPGEWNASVLRVFADGRVVLSDQAGESQATIDAQHRNLGAAAFHIGAKVGGSEFLDGDIAEIAVYDRPLSDAETAEMLDRLKGATQEAPAGDGLALHLDASQAAAEDGGRVAVWKDLSGKGHEMKQEEPARRPVLVSHADGRPLLRFSGGQSLHGPAVLAEGDDSFTLAARWRRRTAEGSQVVCEQTAVEIGLGRRAALLSVPPGEPENHYLLFSSDNLLEWKRLPGSIPDSYECPDMFELPVEGGSEGEKKWVIIDGNGDYITGAFDGTRFTTETAKRKGDHGRNFYATMTFENMPASDPRRIQIAWMRGWDDYPKNMPFNQQASFPCELTLRKLPGGLTLCRNPIREISRLYTRKFSLADHALRPGENPLADVEGELFDIILRVDVARSECDAIVLDLRGNVVKYDVNHNLLHSHGTDVPMKPEAGVVEIRVLMDRLSLEAFGNRGEVSITNLARQQEAPLELRAEGGSAVIRSFELRELRSIWKQ